MSYPHCRDKNSDWYHWKRLRQSNERNLEIHVKLPIWWKACQSSIKAWTQLCPCKVMRLPPVEPAYINLSFVRDSTLRVNTRNDGKAPAQWHGRIHVQCSPLPLDNQGDKDPETLVKNGAHNPGRPGSAWQATAAGLPPWRASIGLLSHWMAGWW